MAIYTPRGLKIRIAIPYAFGLMARLNPKVTPFRVLKTTEGIEDIPSMLAFIGGNVAFVMRLSPLEIGAVVFASGFVGRLLNFFGVYVYPGLIAISTLYSYAAGRGIFLTISVVVGFIFAGWKGVAAYLLGYVAAWVVGLFLDFRQTARAYKLTGHAFTASEVHFFNAYRLHASRIGITTDLELNDGESEIEHWGPTFDEFATQWPEVVSRFTRE